MRAFVLLVLLVGCAETGAAKPQASAASPEATVSVPQFARTATPASAPLPSATAAATAAPSAAPTVAVPDVAAPEPPKPPAPLPDVEVKNVGLHIGGGPNDNVTKRPIREAVKLYFDDLRECYAKALSPKDKETFGVDIRIPGDGGKAKITKPRTAMKGEGLEACLVGVFETVEFSRPPKGMPMTVSFSVEFAKKTK